MTSKQRTSSVIGTHDSLNRTTTFCVGMSAAFATSLLVIALMMAAATCFRTSGLALHAFSVFAVVGRARQVNTV